jgi:hypothetical protein
MMGSRMVGLASCVAFLRHMLAAILKAISEESVGLPIIETDLLKWGTVIG